MSTPFAALEARANGAVLGRLANAIAVVEGVDVPVIFDKPYAAPFGGEVDAAAPECTGPVAGLGALERDSALTIDGIAYVVETAEQDGLGFVRLVLRSV
ncbi:head-tail joining protein [Variovorax paradoxus]|uniref:Uncharacterized protein n=1 Tax=Variovorax paradoxus TaxID=34073 RepID=A0A6I6HJ92_VARPD|nr:hypothetical protein [Variovorax paradoxus]QGW82934.1 hypothetical protein GOQ09_15725 [Variovorax paradoxus]